MLNVTSIINTYNTDTHIDDTFLIDPFTVNEIRKATASLNLGKSPGFDSISAKQIMYAGDSILELLCILFNNIRVLEYIPRRFRYGVQVPLFKGKDLCSLDPNNYRGITSSISCSKSYSGIDLSIGGWMRGWYLSYRGHVYPVFTLPLHARKL